MSEGGGGGGVGNDFIYFLGILMVLFAVWVYSGGPDRQISFTGPFLKPISSTATTAEAYGNPNQYQPLQIGSWSPFGSSGNTRKNSPYAGLVTFSKDTTGVTQSDEHKEYVVLFVSTSAKEPISTNGWRLVSTQTGASASFPQGTELPRSGKVNALSSITLRPGDQATVVTGRSPVGVSFRENMCTGYFAEHQTFYPSLSLACPSAYQELTRFSDSDDEACQTYVRSFGQCRSATTSSGSASNSCESFVDDYLNYSGCADAHNRDQGFYAPAWRIYLGERDELWNKRSDTILLLDASGNTIDALSY